MNRVLVRRLGAGTFGSKFHWMWRACSSNAAAGPSCPISGNTSSEDKSEQYDVAIVGGGMVGMGLACSLAKSPLTRHLKVAIIDSNPSLMKSDFIKKDDLPDARVSTVTPATMSFFEEIGAWKYVEQHRHAYFDKMQVWDYTGLGYTRYNSRDVNKKVLGCVVENKVLLNALVSRVQEADIHKQVYLSRLSLMTILPHSSAIGLHGTTSATELFNHGRLAKLELSDGATVYAKLVVGADGGKSQVRELAGIKTTGWNYSQSAIICTVEHDVENQCAWQRFLPAGPIALLPIGDKFSNIVWTMKPKESLEFKSMNGDDFLKAVNHALDHGYGPHPTSSFWSSTNMFSRFRGDATISATESFEVPPKAVKLVSERLAFPLSLKHAQDYASQRVVLVGDAAHTVHPLAGQGVNMGFGDASSLSRIIAEGITLGSDIGEISLLKKYEADRKPVNIAMMAVLDGFQKAYSVDFGPLNLLRAAAFNGAQVISPLKRAIISYACGEKKIPLFS